MHKFHHFGSVLAAAGLAAFTSGAALAADLDPAPPPPMAPPPMADYGGWYVGIMGGVNFLDSTDFDIAGPTNVSNSYDDGFAVIGSVGYDFGQMAGPIGWRLEGEVSYRANDISSHSIDGGAAITGSDAFGETTALAGMFNVLFDLDTGSPFTIYGGGGIGVASVDFDGHGVTGPGVVMNDDTVEFAWQAIAGAGYKVAENITLDVQYRYFNVPSVGLTAVDGTGSSTDYSSHAVVGGVRFAF